LIASLPSGAVVCEPIVSRPDEDGTWQVCGDRYNRSTCEKQDKACEYEVERISTDEFAPAEQTPASKEYTRKLGAYFTVVLGAWDAVLSKYPYVVGFGLGMPVVMGFLWLLFLFLFAGFIVYTLIVTLLASSTLISVVLCLKAGFVPDYAVDRLYDAVNASAVLYESVTDRLDVQGYVLDNVNTTRFTDSFIDEGDEAHIYYYYIAATVSLVITLLLYIFIFISLKAIRRAIAIVRECTRVFKVMPVLMVWPLIGLTLRTLVYVFGVCGLIYIAYPTVWESQRTTTYLFLVHLFGILWTIQFIKATQYSSIAAAVANWYVSHKEMPRWGLGCRLMLDAAWTIASKHLGSMAFGACVIAICQFLRLMLNLYQYSTREQQKRSLLLRLAIKCAQCAMYCLEKTIEFVSHYSYVFVAIDGTTFCRGCRDTFKLVGNYPAQTAVNQAVKKLLKVIINWSTPAICAAVCFFYLEGDDEWSEEHAALYPALTVFVGALAVSDGITTVLECCIDTIYLCAFKDMEANDPPKFMSDSLRSGFGLARAVAEREAGNDIDGYKPVEMRKAEMATEDAVHLSVSNSPKPPRATGVARF